MSKYDIVPPTAIEKNGSEKQIDDSLVVKYKGDPNLISDTESEMDMLKNAFKTNMDKERETKEKNTNPNFWFAVYFQDEEQKNEFFRKANIASLTEGLYIDGLQFAKAFGIEIQKKEIKPPGKFKSFKQ